MTTGPTCSVIARTWSETVKSPVSPLLGHHVRNVDDGAVKGCQGLPHPAAEEGGDRAGKQAPWTEHEHVGLLYGTR